MTIPPGAAKDPLNHIAWVSAATLKANSWNPNRVFKLELELLERSLLSLGWIQPLLANLNDQIIDGFHRWRLALDSPALIARYKGMVPVARIDVPDDVAMAITVRINRAKGTHGAVSMSDLVHMLVHDHGWAPTRVAEEIGATNEEVDLLLQDSVFTRKKVNHWAYSEAWYPTPSGRSKKEEPTFGGYGDSTIGTLDEAQRAGVIPEGPDA